jgi:hypothetical protein
MLWSGFVLGLLGSFHCAGMCGPIAFMLPLDHSNPTKKYLQVTLYHIGRIFAYAMIGALAGALGRSFNIFGLQQHISIALGVLMIVAVILIYGLGWKGLSMSPVYKWVQLLKKALGAEFKKKSLDAYVTMGFLNGLLPCGLVYMAVFASLSTTSIWQGSVYMIFFGLGTVPLMTLAVYAGQWISVKVRMFMKKAVPLFVIIIGLLFVIRGLGLGIPYVSPVQKGSVQSAQQSCHTSSINF